MAIDFGGRFPRNEYNGTMMSQFWLHTVFIWQQCLMTSLSSEKKVLCSVWGCVCGVVCGGLCVCVCVCERERERKRIYMRLFRRNESTRISLQTRTENIRDV